MTRHLHIDLRPPVDYVLDATADESECTEEMSLFRRAISGDCFFLITGAMVALDLCLVIWLSQR